MFVCGCVLLPVCVCVCVCVCACVCVSCVVEDGLVLVQAQYSSSELGVEAFVAAQVVRRTTLQLLLCLTKLY